MTHTSISIAGERWLVNGQPTYADDGERVAGLLFNVRAANGIFDDLNPETRPRWSHPRFGAWDAEANTDRLIAALPAWRAHGVLALTVDLQGGGPLLDHGFGARQPWDSSGFDPDGTPRPAFLARLERLLRATDDLGMG